MKIFINNFTRSSSNKLEDPNFLYDKYSGKKLLCKHYNYSCEIKNSNSMFDTLKSKFGLPPKDGCIYCKICGEFICDEDFSTLEGFSDNKPIQSNEIIESNEKKINEEKIFLKKLKRNKTLLNTFQLFLI